MTALIVRGDARRLPLPDESVDLIVTSPPYFALRDYRDGDGSLAGQIGAEPTPGEYIDALLRCTQEWMRVLKPSGSCFVNLGDKYAQSSEISRNGLGGGLEGGKPVRADRDTVRLPKRSNGVRTKSLMMLPERYRIGCVDQLGLIARAVICWSKPNGLPESVTDRVRRSHEDWVHLTKEPRYFSAVDAIREQHSPESIRLQRQARERPRKADRHHEVGHYAPTDTSGFGTGARELSPLGKLPGSVWEIATEPLRVPEHLGVDHFAAFPTEWPRRLIQGWSPSGVCTACGEGRRPVADRSMGPDAQGRMGSPHGGDSARLAHRTERKMLDGLTVRTITGEACACTPMREMEGKGAFGKETTLVPDFAGWTPPQTRPSVILDPFGGTGTTALVASVLGRTGISVDLSADYCRLATWRTTDPGERARAMRVPKPPAQTTGQQSLFDGAAS